MPENPTDKTALSAAGKSCLDETDLAAPGTQEAAKFTGAAFPVVWSALNLTTATSAWRIWRAPESAERAPSRGEVLAWWAAAIVIRSGYVPLAFGRRRLWAATADAAILFAVMARYALLAAGSTSPAALLAVPEVAWTRFATVLSTTVAAINSQ